MKKGKVRPLALCVFLDRGRIFVQKGYDSVKETTFYRPLGGAIEFGEYGCQTVIRELREELDVDVEQVRYLGTIESIFTYEGDQGHEICLLYSAQFTDSHLYQVERLIGRDADKPIVAEWISLSDFDHENGKLLYPDGLKEMLKNK